LQELKTGQDGSESGGFATSKTAEKYRTSRISGKFRGLFKEQTAFLGQKRRLTLNQNRPPPEKGPENARKLMPK